MQGHDSLQADDDVILDGGVTAFVDGQSGGGMGIEEKADTGLDAVAGNFRLYERRDVKKMLLARAGNRYFPLKHSLLSDPRNVYIAQAVVGEGIFSCARIFSPPLFVLLKILCSS